MTHECSVRALLGILTALLSLSPACRRSDEVVATKDDPRPSNHAPAAPVEASYFPLVVGTVYEYDGDFDGKKLHSSITVREGDAAIGRVFYFVETDEDAQDNPIIGTESFGLGAYRVTEGGVETAEAFWRKDLASVSTLQTALRLPPLKGATEVLEGNHRLEVIVAGPESVSVPAGTFACVRIDEREIWPDKTYEGAVWLSRGLGVVKRIYTTGRIDVLTRVRFP
jgi:hypothetical protein